jgi:Concanavalin A-like lectin/glucanases superfamily
MNTGGSAAAGGVPDVSDGGVGGEGPTDACPEDADKLEPGECGCGVPESCAPLRDALAHRYSFNQPGVDAVDSVGDAHGTIVGAEASMGKLALGGTTAAYLDLPNGTVSTLRNASFEIWLVWGGGSVWQRIFDFGSNDEGEGNQGAGLTYLYLSPSDGYSGNALRASFSLRGINSETVARAAAPLPTGSLQHLVLVVDDTNNELRLFLNGSIAALTGFGQSLASLQDVNNWVGRSNFADAPLKATIEEVRIYEVALTQAQVTASYGFGPNPSFL